MERVGTQGGDFGVLHIHWLEAEVFLSLCRVWGGLA